MIIMAVRSDVLVLSFTILLWVLLVVGKLDNRSVVGALCWNDALCSDSDGFESIVLPGIDDCV